MNPLLMVKEEDRKLRERGGVVLGTGARRQAGGTSLRVCLTGANTESISKKLRGQVGDVSTTKNNALARWWKIHRLDSCAHPSSQHPAPQK